MSGASTGGAAPDVRSRASPALPPMPPTTAASDLVQVRLRRPKRRGAEVEIDDFDLPGFTAVAARFGQERFGYVVTPNADHLIRYHEDATFRSVYRNAAFVLMDSRVVARLLRLMKRIHVHVCTGADLTAALLAEVVSPRDRIIVVGGDPERAGHLAATYGLQNVRHHNPPMNFIQGKLVEQGSGVGVEIDTGIKRSVLNLPFTSPKVKGHVGKEVILGLRPERITDARSAHNIEDAQLQPIEVKIDVIEPTGPDTLVFAQVNGKRVVSRVHPASNPQPLTNMTLLFDVSKAVLFDPANEERIA